MLVVEKRGRCRPKKVAQSVELITPKRGRPEAYNASYIRAFKKIVKKHGLLKGQKVINAVGVIVNGKHKQITISLPTLSKYVKKEQGGEIVQLKRGRPRHAA